MKKLILLSFCLSIGLAFAVQMPADTARHLSVHQLKHVLPALPVQMPADTARHLPGWPQSMYSAKQSLEAPDFYFSKAPDTLMTSYYDYMIGSYNTLPMRTVPDAAGGGYFFTFHARTTPDATATRSIYHANVDAAGNLNYCHKISSSSLSEGYPAVAVDPVSGTPMYAWHANAGGAAPPKVFFACIPPMGGFPSPIFEPQIIIDNPITISGSHDNAFIWPQIQIGPSPNPDMRRVYVAASNLVSHAADGLPSENFMIAYADFDSDMLSMGEDLSWSYTTVPELNLWNHDQQIWRRPFFAFNVDDSGKLYLGGYHTAFYANGDILAEADLDVFMCSDYGAGTWTRMTDYSDIPVEIPGSPGFYSGKNDLPATEEDYYLAISNSKNINAVNTGDGKIIFPALFTICINADSSFPELHTVKAVVCDPAVGTFETRDIYPQKHPDDDFNDMFTPWDRQPPWGVPEYITGPDGEDYLDLEKHFPFPHWNTSLHENAMMTHYNHLKLSQVNEQRMMVAVWQDSQRARWKNKYNDPDYTAFASSSEIYISVSSNRGQNWSKPIVLNNVETPEFAGIRPMWVYPADYVTYMGEQNGCKIGRLGLMFYNDYSWGAHALPPSAHPINDGGQVMFAELQIVFPDFPTGSDDPSHPVPAVCGIKAAYPNPFKDQLNLDLQVKDSYAEYSFKVFNIKGQLVHKSSGTAKGNFALSWDGRDAKGSRLPSGIYLLNLCTKGHQSTRKVILQ